LLVECGIRNPVAATTDERLIPEPPGLKFEEFAS
jgi:hypothetical protein